ncbi:glucose-6-phosphate 1-epimerase, partial [Phenoliferia sp. Uapishka_3]
MSISSDSTSVKLSLPNGDSASIAFLGATVHSYIHNKIERFFVSSKSSLNGPAAIRGGIPICWPIFGPPDKEDERFNKMKQHGFARTCKWSLDEQASVGDGDKAVAVLTLDSSPTTQALYAPTFHLTYTVTLSPTSLLVSLKVLSPSTASSPLSFQALLHSYLRLPPSILPPTVTAKSLTGLSFVDKVQGGAKGLEDRKEVLVDGPKGEVDRVYHKAPDALGLSWSGGEAKVTKENLADVVLWNPGPEKGATMGDMEEGGADRFICLEPGQVGSYVDLKAGEAWEGSVKYEFTA